MFESWIVDVRYAVRRLIARPTYTLLAVLTLALGAGGSAAIFSVVRTLLVDPLPIAREDQVGVFWFTESWTEQEFLRLRPDFPGFERVAAYRPDDLTLEAPGSPMRLLPGIAVSAELFDVLGAAPVLGRTFGPGEDAAGAEQVAVISHSLWRDLGGNPALVGRTLQLGGVARTVVGIMPQGFWFPSPTTSVWTPAQMDPQNRAGLYSLVGRVAPGRSIAHMEGPLQALTQRLAASIRYSNPRWDKTKNPSITPVREYFVGDVRPSLLATLAAMGAILLIASANVAALMLGQVDTRATELAVRAALGANRQRLIQQLVIESALVGLLAGAAGAVLATVAFGVLVQSLPLGALAENTRLDWTVFWSAMATALSAAVLVAMVPGVALWRGGSLQASISAARTGCVGGRGSQLESGLVVAQTALALLLVASAGLLIRSVANLRAIDPGVRLDGLAVVDASLPTRLTDDERRRAIEAVLPSLRALPGVVSVAATQKLPLRGSGDNWGIRILGRPEAGNGTTAFRMVTSDYFRTMGVPLRSGRDFGPEDRDGTGRVVIVNEALAARFFPGEDPIGRVLRTFDDAGERIIGVAGNVAEARLTETAVPTRYMLYAHVRPVRYQVSFVIRTGDEAALTPLLNVARATIARDGGQFAVQQTTTMQDVFDQAMGPVGQVVTLLSLLAGLALVLGAVGVYGAISHDVTRRSRDYAVQIALGRQPTRVVRQVITRGVALVAGGSVIGVVAAMLVTGLLASLLHGVEAHDPVTLAGAAAVLMLVGLVAAFVPARRASLTDPAVVLRQGT